MSSDKLWIVQKFGGSALKDTQNYSQIVQIINEYSQSYQVAVVTSALYGVTDRLEGLINLALEHNDDLSVASYSLQKEHLDWATAVLNDPDKLQKLQFRFAAIFTDLEAKLNGIRNLKFCPDKIHASILVIGEILASEILYAVISDVNKSDVQLYSYKHIKADLQREQQSYLDANFNIEKTRLECSDHYKQANILIIPGFVASDEAGQQVTLGRNGSDYTATSFAAVLGAKSCQIWKDVNGINTADPNIVPGSKVLTDISYAEAMELSYFGAKVINAKALLPLTLYEIPCEIKNFHHPESKGTSIGFSSTAPKTIQQSSGSDSNHVNKTIKGVTHRSGLSCITVSGFGLRGVIGFARRVSDSLAREGISIILIVQSSSEYSLTLCVTTENAERAVTALNEEFYYELEQSLIEPIDCQHGKAAVSLVGEGMKHRRGVAARFLAAVASARINVEILAQGSTECAIAMVTDASMAPLAVKAAHSAFFNEEMPLDIILMGCGTVGKELIEQMQRQQEALREQNIGLNVWVIARSKTLLSNENGINLDTWESDFSNDAKAYSKQDIIDIKDQYGLLNPVLVDCTTSEHLSREYIDYLRAGFHVVTANKKANTLEREYYAELRLAARQNFRKFLYETNVGAGLPVLDTLQSLIRSGDKLKGFQGILSGSLSLILGLLEDGQSFSEAVLKAKSLGFTEPDPREDLSGLDVARKLLIIAREVGMPLELEDIEVEPLISDDFNHISSAEAIERLPELNQKYSELIANANKENKIIRYLATINNGKCKVGIEFLDKDNPVAGVRDGENVIALQTNYYDPKPLVLRGYGAGAAVTAAGMFGDLLRTLRLPSDI